MPVRLDNCEIPYRELKPIQHADLFPINDDNVWKEGVKQILRAIGFTSVLYCTPPKLSPPFRGEKSIFVDREEYIHNALKEYLKPSSSSR
jgi:hypothetical protein